MLNSKQRSYLASLANPIDPICQVGKEGVSPTAVQSVMEAFNTHELIKVTVLKTAPDTPADSARMMAERSRSQLVRVIGRRFILYKPFRENPKIELPR